MSLILDGTNGLSDVDGSAATPAIRGSDANTGVFFGTDIVGLSTGGTERVRVDASGNVGIGVTPSAWFASNKALQIGSTGAVSNYTNGGNIQTFLSNNVFWNAAGTISYITTNTATSYTQDNGTHKWYNAASGTAGNAITFTQAMTLTSSGDLLVGTTSGYLNSRVNLARDSTTSSPHVVNMNNSACTSTVRTQNSLVRIASQGSGADVNINFTDNVLRNYWFGGNNGGAYVVAGTNGVRLADGGTSWASDSDERVKDIIEPITNAAEKVSTLRAVIGKYKTDEEGTRRAFLIAQDVQAVLPEAVVAQSDEIGTLSLAYTEVIPLLVAAIKEQQAIITALTARVEALEGAQA